jgi:capsular polysaccharide biosynthesis protein
VDDAEPTAVIGRIAAGDAPPPAPAAPAEPRASSWGDSGPDDADRAGGPAMDTASGLASISFITAVLRRRRWLWCVTAVAGLLLGAGLYVEHPPAYQATTQTYLTLGPNEDLGTSILTEIALAQSRPVAAIALRRLGEHDTVSDFLSTYTPTQVTNRVMLITVKATSAAAAVRTANAVTVAYLQFRASQLRLYQQLVLKSLNQQIASATAAAGPVARQIAALQAAPTPAGKARLNDLQSQLTALDGEQISARQSSATVTAQTTQAISDSRIIDAATALPHSHLKTPALYTVMGLIGGGALGMGFVVVMALVSDRLRLRDDVAHALGASVRLSAGRVTGRRLLPGRPRLAAADRPGVQRIASHLRAQLDTGRPRARLAVVPADRAETAALALMALALASAAEGKRVMIADLFPGAPAARLAGVTTPGVGTADVRGSQLMVAVPERGDLMAAGPIAPAPAPTPAAVPPAEPDPQLVAAYESSDMLLTLAALDPMVGSDHLTTWSADVVVTVTAGRSTWTRVQAVGEMIRLTGARLVSAVLLEADEDDESLGIATPPRAGRHLRADESLVMAAPRISQDTSPRNGSHPGNGSHPETVGARPDGPASDA